jgi:RNA polymerase sigma-70 factor, ECF subfamily
MASPQQTRGQRSEVRSQRSEVRSQRSEVRGQESDLESLIEIAHSRGISAHGDLGLALEDFTAHVKSIIVKRLGSNPSPDAAGKVVAGLRADDLYLAAACAHNSAAAWSRLAAIYDKHIDDVSHAVCSTHQEAREIASTVLAHLFFRDREGQCRIASYEGRSSLGTWISTIIKHRAINRRQLKSAEAEPLDALRHTPSAAAAREIEAALLRSKYREPIADSFKTAAEQLNERERLVLVLRFEDELTATEVARMIGVHPAQITRTVKQAELKFRSAVFERLSRHHGLSSAAIEECLAEIVGSPDLSVVSFLRLATPASQARPVCAA